MLHPSNKDRLCDPERHRYLQCTHRASRFVLILQEFNMDQKSFDEYPVIGAVNLFIDLLAYIAARGMNAMEGESNDAAQSITN